MTALHALARSRARARVRRLRLALAVVGRRPRGVLGARSGTSSRSPSATPPSRARRARDARGPLVRGRRAQLRRARLPRQARAEVGGPARLRAARARRASLGRAARAGRRGRRGLRALGVGRGDRVVAYLPNIPEALVAFLATASLGAVWSSCSPGLRPRQRRRPLRPDRAKVLFARGRLPLRRQGLRPPRHGRRARGGRSRAWSGSSSSPTSSRRPRALGACGARADDLGRAPRRSARACELPSSGCPSTTRSGSSTRPAPPACRRRSSRATAESCSST